jgi:hypothetical protein
MFSLCASYVFAGKRREEKELGIGAGCVASRRGRRRRRKKIRKKNSRLAKEMTWKKVLMELKEKRGEGRREESYAPDTETFIRCYATQLHANEHE